MPKLNIDFEWEGRKPFYDMAVNTKFESSLPSAATFAAASVDELFAISPDTYAGMSFDNWADTSVRSIYNVANVWGTEDLQIPSVGGFANDMVSMSRLPPDVVASEMVAQTVIHAVDAVMSAVAVIPVYGWIINGAWKVGRGIYDTVQMFRHKDPEVALKAISFDSDADTDKTRQALDVTEWSDWTRVFLPPVSTSSFESQLIGFGTDDDGSPVHGYAIRPVGEKALFGFGVLPGIPQVFNNFQVPKVRGTHPVPPFCYTTWKTGGEYIPAPGINLCSASGAFTPTLQQLGLTMWSMARTGDANAFKVDQNTINSEWENYFAALVDYHAFYAAKGPASVGPDGNDLQKAHAIRETAVLGVINTGAPRPNFPNGAVRTWGVAENVPGFHDFVRELAATNAPGAFIKNPPKSLRFTGFGLEQEWQITYGALVRFMVKDQLNACYNRFLKTIVVAYVDETFPAIGGPGASPMMKSRWEENRAKLLASSAVKQVELDLIPDAAYADLVEQSQKMGGWNIAAPPTPGYIDQFLATPDEPLYPHPPPLLPPGTPEEQATWWEKWGPWVLGTAALAGTAYLGYRFSQRKANGLYLPTSVG